MEFLIGMAIGMSAACFYFGTASARAEGQLLAMQAVCPQIVAAVVQQQQAVVRQKQSESRK